MDIGTVDHLLTTTRSVRKRLDLVRPVGPETIQRCLDIAIQAPAGGNLARYHFLVVTDPVRRSKLAELYKRALNESYIPRRSRVQAPFPESESGFFEGITYLGEHLAEVPAHIIPCFDGRVENNGTFWQASMYGCILPATWSLMLALRARGVGSSFTTLHLMFEKEAAALLRIPDTVTQAGLIPVAYFTGADFKPAKRVPAQERTYWDAWGETRS
jgi:nitroreductase